jgi:hypothetical protein
MGVHTCLNAHPAWASHQCLSTYQPQVLGVERARRQQERNDKSVDVSGCCTTLFHFHPHSLPPPPSRCHRKGRQAAGPSLCTKHKTWSELHPWIVVDFARATRQCEQQRGVGSLHRTVTRQTRARKVRLASFEGGGVWGG